MRILQDTNIILRKLNSADAEHVLVRQAIAQLISAGWEICIAPQNLFEFWSVATRPVAVNGLGLTPEVARGYLEGLLQADSLLPTGPTTVTRWLDLCTRYGVCGRQAHDAHLAAHMLAQGVKHLLTLNSVDFLRYPEITVLTPAQVLSGGEPPPSGSTAT